MRAKLFNILASGKTYFMEPVAKLTLFSEKSLKT